MTIACKNCHNNFKGNYCSNCGQPASTHEMNFHFLWHDVQHGLLHLDKGILFSIKELFTRPGYSIKEFIQGKRVRHFKPISLVLLLAGVLGLLFHFFHIDLLSNIVTVNASGEDSEKVSKLVSEVSEWLAGHYALVSLLSLPLFALGTWMAFRKAGYNFVEHLVINAFLTAQRLALQIFLFPLYIIFNGSSSLPRISSWINVVSLGLALWTFFQLFDSLKKTSVFFRTILSLLIYLVLFIGVLVAMVFLFLPKELQ